MGYNGVSDTLKLANSTLSHNYADANRGGIFVQSGEVDLTNVTIAKNYADSDELSGGSGGGISVDIVQPTHLYMVNTLIATNKLGDGSKSDYDEQ